MESQQQQRHDDDHPARRCHLWCPLAPWWGVCYWQQPDGDAALWYLRQALPPWHHDHLQQQQAVPAAAL
jgi:hypothetical protein